MNVGRAQKKVRSEAEKDIEKILRDDKAVKDLKKRKLNGPKADESQGNTNTITSENPTADNKDEKPETNDNESENPVGLSLRLVGFMTLSVDVLACALWGTLLTSYDELLDDRKYLVRILLTCVISFGFLESFSYTVAHLVVSRKSPFIKSHAKNYLALMWTAYMSKLCLVLVLLPRYLVDLDGRTILVEDFLHKYFKFISSDVDNVSSTTRTEKVLLSKTACQLSLVLLYVAMGLYGFVIRGYSVFVTILSKMPSDMQEVVAKINNFLVYSKSVNYTLLFCRLLEAVAFVYAILDATILSDHFTGVTKSDGAAVAALRAGMSNSITNKSLSFLQPVFMLKALINYTHIGGCAFCLCCVLTSVFAEYTHAKQQKEILTLEHTTAAVQRIVNSGKEKNINTSQSGARGKQPVVID